MATSVPPAPDHEPHEGSAWLTGEQISAINRFPDDNPNPVLRVDGDGHLIYANPASAGVLAALGIAVGERLPPEELARIEAVAPGARPHRAHRGRPDVRGLAGPDPGPRLHEPLRPGRHRRAGDREVPGREPEPGPAHRLGRPARVREPGERRRSWPGSGSRSGSRLPAAAPGRASWTGRERASATRSRWRPAARIYGLLPVDVPGFGFINVYGTDVTAEKEHARLARDNERLLLNVLPEPIARRLRDGEPLIADRFEDVTLLFADIVEFTRLSASLSPSELVGVLNEVFTVFDDLVERYGLEKVKTIGDAYMVVGGMPERSDDHTVRVAAMALDLAECVGGIEAARRLGIAFRIGIHCGPVVAGVIGTKKFIYDVWGDTVNLASRMESLGQPGRVQVTHAVRERLDGTFDCEARGLIDVKGKGPTPTWFLVGRSPERRPAAGRAAVGRAEASSAERAPASGPQA